MKIGIALIGYGNVGRALHSQIQGLNAYQLHGIAVKNAGKHPELKDKGLLAKSALQVIEQPEVQVVLEAINEAEASFTFAERSLQMGKVYISASKKMLATKLPYLHLLEAKHGGKLFYEASVAAAIPVLRTLREHLRGESIDRVRGILNGTCNYILSRMHQDQLDFDAALEEAQRMGFAESDPSSDIDAEDAYCKSLILAYTLEGGRFEVSRAICEGIRSVSAEQVRQAKRAGEKIKLIADIERKAGKFRIDIRPQRIGPDDVLYHVERESNAVCIRGSACGELLLQGPGAGGAATASAMRADLLNLPPESIRNLRRILHAVGVH